MPGINKAEIATRLEAARSEFARNLGLREDVFIEQSADSIDQAQEAQVRDLAIRTLDHSVHHLRRIESALRRLADGEYGICENCDQPISAKRLSAVPWAHLCIRCQEAADRSEEADAGYAGSSRPFGVQKTENPSWSPPDVLTAA